MPDAETHPVRERGRIHDDRGRRVTQLDPVMMHLLHQHQVIPADPLRDIAQAVGLGLRKVTRVIFIIAMLNLILVFVALSVDFVRGVMLGGTPIGAFLDDMPPMTAVVFGPLFLWLVACNVRFRRIRAAMLEHRRCSHCGYDLRDLPPDPEDNATICPECGCAWKLSAPDPAQADDG